MRIVRWGWLGSLVMCVSAAGQVAPWGNYPSLPTLPQATAPQSDPADVLRYTGEPATARWYQLQNQLTEKILSGLPGREKLLARIRELQVKQNAVSLIREDSDHLFYTQTGTDGLMRLLARNRATNAERLLYVTEPAERVAEFWPSPDGAQVAVALQVGEQGGVHLKLLTADSGEVTEELPSGVSAGQADVCWLPDSSGLMYSSQPKGQRGVQVWLHKAGKPSSGDTAVLAPETQKWAAAGDELAVITRTDSDVMIARQKHASGTGISYYYAHRSGQTGVPGNWTLFIRPADAVSGLALTREQVVLLSVKRAARGEVLLLNQKTLQIKTAKTLLAPSAERLAGLKAGGDSLYLHSLDGTESRLYQLGLDGKKTMLELPVAGNLVQWRLNADGQLRALTMEGLLLAPQTYHADQDGHFYPFGTAAAGSTVAPTAAAMPQLWRITLTPVGQAEVMHFSGNAKGPLLMALVKTDNGLPVPHFQPGWTAWLERGGSLAIVFPELLVSEASGFSKIRASVKNKAAVLPDQVDWLLQLAQAIKARDGASRMVLQDMLPGSGLALVMATRQPGLFTALSASDPIAQNPQTLLAPSVSHRTGKQTAPVAPLPFAFDQVYAGMDFPSTLLQAHSDAGVAPLWMAAKMVVALQILAPRNQAFLLNAPLDGKTDSARDLADAWAFFLWQSGNADFVPASIQAINKPQAISKPRSSR